MMNERYSHSALLTFSTALLQTIGLAEPRARVVSEILVEGDLLGHPTHGLNLLSRYLSEIDRGTMTVAGDPEVVSDHGAAVTWDGGRLPGPWLVNQALDLALERAERYGVCVVTIRRSHHIACLSAYMARAAARRCVVILLSSDPSQITVAPFGGKRPLLTPNPIAAAYPAGPDPVLVDVSTSTTTNGLTATLLKQGRQLDHPWLVDSHGTPSTDPRVLATDPPGAILPLGDMTCGHKGFALSVLVEALTSGLAGYGRADAAKGWGASVFLQVISPRFFGGAGAFERETSWLADAARNTPASGSQPVRMPGDRALAKKTRQLEAGVELEPHVMVELGPWAARLGVAMPAPL